MTATDVIVKCNTLKKFWQKRDAKFKQWYKLIQQVDELAQANMESFVGNDPRAAYNLTLHMLDSDIPHRIPAEDLDREMIGAASKVEAFYKTAWQDVYKRGRKGLSEGFMRDLIGFLIATGWHSVFTQVTPDGKRCMAEVWNPATVFPNFDMDMVECAHIQELTPASARRMVIRNGWPVEVPKTKMTLYDYWWTDDHDAVFNSIVLGTTLVKVATPEPRFKRIPIFVGAVGGLPDTGPLQNVADTWKEEKGQASIATNAQLYRQWNKWWTYSMQILRDTAQPKIFERSASSTKIVKPEEIYKRGVIWKGGPQDSIEYVTPPPIPMELRTTSLDMEAMMQRGGPSWALFGAVQQQLTSYVFAQIAASAQQMAKPFHQGIVNLMSDIDNFWLDMIRQTGVKPYGFEIPPELPTDVEISAAYEIRIPGDLTRRATEARMLNPDFRLSLTRVYDEVFPEIQNPLVEQARVRADRAEQHPLYAMADLIVSFREQSKELSAAGEPDGARLYALIADKLEAQLSIAQEETERVQPRPAIGAGPEAMPPEPRTPA